MYEGDATPIRAGEPAPGIVPTLRQALATEPCILIPGVYDCVSAMMAERAGFRAVAISGYAVSASLYGLPDLGFIHLHDMVQVAQRIVNAVSVPVICDADTGYGGPNQVWQTVRMLESAGVQGILFEDQIHPKKCGGMAGRGVVSLDEMLEKITAARDARRQPDTVLIARTDAKETLGLDEVIRRLNRYLGAGADLAFAAEPYTPEEVQHLAREVQGPVAICGGVPGWSGSMETRSTYISWNIKAVLYPFTSLYPATKAMERMYQAMASTEGVTSAMTSEHMVDFDWYGEFLGLNQWRERESSFGRG